ncbi:MAG TPA: hypothetical protein VN695_18630 [Streptosporangiaceae bacterium]|nr:hypothetical protein [Streptosporangiaceae bacterium]
MGWTKERVNDDGKIRYQAWWRDHRGHERSAGTYSTERQAD